MQLIAANKWLSSLVAGKGDKYADLEEEIVCDVR